MEDVLKELEFHRSQLQIDDTNLNKELAQYAAYYCRVLQIANFCEENFDKVEALTDSDVRRAALASEEKVTEKIVEARVKSNPDYQTAYSARNAARALKEAYKAKGNMLIQLSTNIREEMKNLSHSVNADVQSYAQYL